MQQSLRLCLRIALLAVLCVLCTLLAIAHATKVIDSHCEVDALQQKNEAVVPILLQLRKEKYFSVFKVDLHSECPFWRADMQCHRKGCAVCDDACDVPDFWERTSPVDRSLAEFPGFKGWQEDNDDLWTVQDDSSRMAYIDVNLNPESYTGYEGQDAWKIWAAINEENCFHGSLQDMCYEERVFYRLISGLHSCISSHIAANYPQSVRIDDDVLGPSLEVFERKLGNNPEWLNNLYFTFAFLLRAVNKASPTLAKINYRSGNAEVDARVASLVSQLLNSELVSQCVPSFGFDESVMFSSPDTATIKKQFKERFKNISRIMDCVTCEKCKLHGKLQILGIGTALRILFSQYALQPEDLQRNEVMALIVTLAKFSNAVRNVELFRRQRAAISFADSLRPVLVGATLAACVITALLLRRRSRKAEAKLLASKLLDGSPESEKRE